jgi:hypothetical protein
MPRTSTPRGHSRAASATEAELILKEIGSSNPSRRGCLSVGFTVLCSKAEFGFPYGEAKCNHPNRYGTRYAGQRRSDPASQPLVA